MLLSVTMQWSALSWDLVLIILVLAVVVPWRGRTRVRMLLSLPQLSSAQRISLYGSTIAFSLRQLSQLPLEKRGQLYQIAAKLMPQELTEALVFVALVGTVSLCEELVYRGFVFAVFQRVSGSAAVAIVGSAVLFALGHIYQGRRGTASTFALGLLLAGARSWSGSLLPAVMAAGILVHNE
jgi:membrane protease YdiL (CAAX protease family)